MPENRQECGLPIWLAGGRSVPSGPQCLSPAEGILTSENRGLDYTHGTHLWWVRDQKRSRGRCPDFGSSSRFCGTTDDRTRFRCRPAPQSQVEEATSLRPTEVPPVGAEPARDSKGNCTGAT